MANTGPCKDDSDCFYGFTICINSTCQNIPTTKPDLCSTTSVYDCKEDNKLCCHGVCKLICECVHYLDCPVNYDCVSGYCSSNHQEEPEGGIGIGIFGIIMGIGLVILLIFIFCKRWQRTQSRLTQQRQQMQNAHSAAADYPMQVFPPTPGAMTDFNPPPYPATGQLPTNSTLTGMSDAPPDYNVVMSHPNIFHPPTEQDRNYNRTLQS